MHPKPAYVLTSKETFSGDEEFSYNLKNLKRATIRPIASHYVRRQHALYVELSDMCWNVSRFLR